MSEPSTNLPTTAEVSTTVEPATHREVRRLAWRYLFVLAAVAALMVVDQAIIQPMLVRLNAFAPAINVAGRQRMLSQRLAKAALTLDDATEAAIKNERRDELRQSLDRWTAEHDALLDGDEVLGIRRIETPELDAEWKDLEPHYRAMVAAATTLAEEDAALAAAEQSAAVSAIVEHEADFLATMDRIVKLMEDEAARAVWRLRAYALAIAATVVALLVGLGWFVVRPATRTIRTQFDELESRVAERTRELSVALESLQHEVQEREAAELRHQRISAQLTHAERVSTMGHLTAGLAHELNQPLAAIANYTEASDVLLGGLPADVADRDELGRVREFVSLAKRAALRAGQIVRRMRNFVKPNASGASEVGINSLVTEIEELCRNEASNSAAEIALQLDAENDVVFADPIQIQQVLVNLVQNSLQAMSANGSDPRRMILRTKTVGAFAQIDVRDTGPGFAVADPETVFAPFHTTKADGLGIGLSICRSIVEHHRGTIWTESSSGRGAQVSFTLPLSHPHADSIRLEANCVCC
jgi:two-component system sensor kinase FixL